MSPQTANSLTNFALLVLALAVAAATAIAVGWRNEALSLRAQIKPLECPAAAAKPPGINLRKFM